MIIRSPNDVVYGVNDQDIIQFVKVAVTGAQFVVIGFDGNVVVNVPIVVNVPAVFMIFITAVVVTTRSTW